MRSPQPAQVVGILLAVLPLSCLVVVTVFVLWAAALSPNYSHASQFISELGATGAPNELIVRLAGFLPAGVLLLGVYLAKQRRQVEAL